MPHPIGTLIVLSGPSGVGKGLLKKHLAQHFPYLLESISATTRAPRAGEEDGREYTFVSQERFKAMILEGALLEWAEFAGHFYGTPAQAITQSLQKGQSVMLEIEVKGALQVKEKFPDAHLIFIAPPSLQVLESRLRGRNTNNDNDIERRLSIARVELAQQSRFDTVIINDDLNTCVQELQSVIQALVSQ